MKRADDCSRLIEKVLGRNWDDKGFLAFRGGMSSDFFSLGGTGALR
jgi:hypothetical protein